MRVSVIIPNHNYAKFLPETVSSVLNQTYQDLEIIVVDNGSTDNSLEILKKYPNVQVISQLDLGQAMARHVGVLHSSGDVIAFLDADDFWHPEKITEQMKLIFKGHSLVLCSIQYVAKNGEFLRSFSYGNDRMDFAQLPFTRPGISIIEAGESSVILTKALYYAVGGFDLTLTSSSGWDLFRRCAKKEIFGIVNRELVYYRQHDENLSKNTKKMNQEFLLCYRKVLSEMEKSFFLGLLLAARVDIIYFKSLLLGKASFREYFTSIPRLSILYQLSLGCKKLL